MTMTRLEIIRAGRIKARRDAQEQGHQERRNRRERTTLHEPPSTRTKAFKTRQFHREGVASRLAEGLCAVETGAYEGIGVQE
jgi:hypothetical protein